LGAYRGGGWLSMVMALLRSLIPRLYVELSLELSTAGRALLRPLHITLSLGLLPLTAIVKIIFG